jgi:hypothetical protein
MFVKIKEIWENNVVKNLTLNKMLSKKIIPLLRKKKNHFKLR